jgi:hypothetical protein
MNLNMSIMTEHKTMVKDNSRRTIIVKIIEKGNNKGKFNVTVFDKKTSNSTFDMFDKIGEVTRKYDNRDWEPQQKPEKLIKPVKPITPEEKQNIIDESKPQDNFVPETSISDEDPKDNKPAQGDDVVTLKQIIDELISEKILPESLKMKKVRRILRGHQEELSEGSAKKGESFRWAWTTNIKDTLKKDISKLLK